MSNLKNSPNSPPVAYPVDDNITKVQIPAGLRPGDSFVVSPPNGRSFTVIVPEGSAPGTFISIVIPNDSAAASADPQSDEVKFKRAAVGAAAAGAVVGALLLGPLGALVFGGGAAYATTRKEGKIGKSARSVGDRTYTGLEDAANWINKKVSK